MAGWNFETLRTGTLAGFVDGRLHRFPRLDIRQDACSCAFFTEEKALGLGRRTWSGTGEFCWQFGLLVKASAVGSRRFLQIFSACNDDALAGA